MPKRRISSGPQQDCSDGAKMLIEQMKLHPEEFKGYAGKFTNLLDTAREASQGLHRNVKMSQRDSAAILAAAEEHLYEVWLAEDVLTNMMAPKPESEKDMVYAAPVKADRNNSVYINEAYRMEQARYEMERRQMEDFKQREDEYAMRNTKPFGKFI